ncbi:hypothetical protein ACFOZY_03360 [Chungangia koreensis]|uniref:Uncharacterized protein n=1 Tax=Chungangia koreensis TaxID=752657 RepID=A0ABV8X0L2_9LACT
MGYILPIQPNQSGLYAGRTTMDRYDYANVHRVVPVKPKSLFEEELEEKLHENDRLIVDNYRMPSIDRAENTPIQHAALAQEISLVVGKGLQINTYV